MTSYIVMTFWGETWTHFELLRASIQPSLSLSSRATKKCILLLDHSLLTQNPPWRKNDIILSLCNGACSINCLLITYFNTSINWKKTTPMSIRLTDMICWLYFIAVCSANHCFCDLVNYHPACLSRIKAPAYIIHQDNNIDGAVASSVLHLQVSHWQAKLLHRSAVSALQKHHSQRFGGALTLKVKQKVSVQAAPSLRQLLEFLVTFLQISFLAAMGPCLGG